MKKISSSLLAASLVACSTLTTLYANPPAAQETQAVKPATMKVLIVKNAEDALIEIKGRYMVYNPLNNLMLSSGLLGKRDQVTVHENGLKWGETYPGIYQLYLVPGDSQSTILVNGIQHRGCLSIYNIDDLVQIVNEVDIESYLKATLTGQFSEETNEEVLDALAIVARTGAYNYISRNPNAFWNVDAQEVGYQGYGLTFQNINVDRAVDRTRYVVLTFNNQPFAATWTKDSAGKTADFTSIFRKEAKNPPPVVAPLAALDREKHHWSFAMSKESLAKALHCKGIAGIDLYLEKNSSKVYAVRVKDQAESKDVGFFQLQKSLGKNKLLSNDFTVSVKGDSVVFSGYGEGHGVGLCLYSAKRMAERGDKTNKILSSFFPNTQLQKWRSLPDQVEVVR